MNNWLPKSLAILEFIIILFCVWFFSLNTTQGHKKNLLTDLRIWSSFLVILQIILYVIF